MSNYRFNIFQEISILLGKVNHGKALDFGCGDGWFASNFLEASIFSDVVGVDVKTRTSCLIEPIIYDGNILPFNNREFDIVYAIDVLHHCHNPRTALLDMARCSKKFLLVKDHTCTGTTGALALQLLDWMGNIRFGIPSPGNYQRGFEWDEELFKNGWRLIKRIHPLACHKGIMGEMTNHLQYVALYERC